MTRGTHRTLHPAGRLWQAAPVRGTTLLGPLLFAVVATAGCESTPVLDERAVAEPAGRALDLSLLGLPGGAMALGWRDSALPNGAHARAALLMLGPGGSPRGPLLRDDNESEAASPLIATSSTILRVLAERGDADSWGLVAVVRDIETGQRLPDGYRTLPVFAGAALTDLQLVPTTSGALLAWVERGGVEIPADFVQVVALDVEGWPLGPPVSLTQLPSDVVAIDLQPWSDGQEAVLVALARRGASAQVWIFRFDVGEALHLSDLRQLGANISNQDRVLQLATFDRCVELLVTRGGFPAHATFDPAELPGGDFADLSIGDAPAVAPRLLSVDGSRILYVYDRPDGSTQFRTIDHVDRSAADPCDTNESAERSFPLPSERCIGLATLPGSPLPYACAAACLTEACGDEWIWVGRADL